MDVESLRNPSWLKRLADYWRLLRLILIGEKYAFGTRVAGWMDKSGNVAFEVSRVYGREILKALGHSVEVIGAENVRDLEGCFCAASIHQSHLDSFILLGYFPTPLQFVAKKELRYIPAIGQFLAKRGILIDRNGRKAALEAIEKAILANPAFPILLFPEGTRSEDGEPQQFKRGGLGLFTKHQRPIVPVTITNTFAYLPKGAKAMRLGGHFKLILGKPIFPEQFESEEAVVNEVQKKVHETFLRERDASLYAKSDQPAVESSSGSLANF